MGYAGVELVRKIFGDHLQDLSALVVGAGEMGRLAARHLKSAGVGRIWVANRTRERATALALELGGAPVLAWDQLAEALQVVDLVVASTSAPEPVVTAEDVRRAVKARRGRPLMFLDLAVPRDVEPGVEALAETVFRYDIDDLALVVAENRRRRQEEVRRVEEVIGEEQRAFRREMEVADIAPVIRRLREKAEGIRQQELAEAWRQLGHLSDHDRAVVDRTTRLILNKLLNDPMISIRGWAGRPEGSLYLDAVRRLFRLDDAPQPVADDD
jgi:glutamyl-tRNA reductase